MTEINKIFAVVDPTTKNQRALNRAALGAKSTGASVHAYACVHSKVDAHKVEELIRIEMSEYQAWLEALVKPIRDDGIEVEWQWQTTGAARWGRPRRARPPT